MKTFKTFVSILILALAIAGAAQADDLKARTESESTAATQLSIPPWGLDGIDPP